MQEASHDTDVVYAPTGKGTVWFWTPGKSLQICSQFASVKCKLKICTSGWYSNKSFKMCKQYATLVKQLKLEIGMGMEGSLLLMQKDVTADLHELEKILYLK